MQVAPFILKIRYMLFLANNAVSLFRRLIIIFPHMYELSQLRQSLCHQFKIFPDRALQFLTSFVYVAVIIIQILYII